MLSPDLLEKILNRIAPTKEERLAIAAERSREFNDRVAKQFESMKMTPELLAKRCTL